MPDKDVNLNYNGGWKELNSICWDVMRIKMLLFIITLCVMALTAKEFSIIFDPPSPPAIEVPTEVPSDDKLIRGTE